MANHAFSISLPAISLCGILFLYACDSGSSDPGTSADLVRELTIRTNQPQLLGIGATTQLIVIVRDETGAQLRNVEVKWSSSDPSIATVDESGLVTAQGVGEFVVFAEAGIARAEHELRVWPNVPDERDASTPFAFIDVQVLTMEGDQVLTNQTVVVEDGRIQAIGPAGTVSIPPAAERIEASGYYLMPGLADMHTHVQSGTVKDGSNSLLLYLANGVTTILNMGDYTLDILTLRRQVNDGRIPGPNIYAAKFARGQADGGNFNTIVETPEAARTLVRNAKTDGYDLIKIYNSVSKETFDAIIEEGHALGIAAVGHGVREPGMEYILENGLAMIAHAEEFIYTIFNNQIVPGQIASVANLTAQSRAYLTPTLSTYATIGDILIANQNQRNALAMLQEAPETRYLTPERIANWQRTLNIVYNGPGDLGPRLRFQQQFLKTFHDVGVPLLLGTDSPAIPGLMPGFSIYVEMDLLSEANLSNSEVLRAGTKNAGAFFAEHVPGGLAFGTISVGYRADLILLRANPLESLDHLRTARVGVMSNGRWFSELHLHNLLEAETN